MNTPEVKVLHWGDTLLCPVCHNPLDDGWRCQWCNGAYLEGLHR